MSCFFYYFLKPIYKRVLKNLKREREIPPSSNLPVQRTGTISGEGEHVASAIGMCVL